MQNGKVKLSGLEIESDEFYTINGGNSGTETHTLGTVKKASYSETTI